MSRAVPTNLPRAAAALAAAVLAACGARATNGSDARPDAPTLDVDGADARDARPEAPSLDAESADGRDVGSDVPVLDAGSDAACVPCAQGHCPDLALCTGAPALLPGAPLTMQDTATGGYGDCATFASGAGGRNLYYAVTLPPGKFTRVVAAPVTPGAETLLRVFPDCHVTQVSEGSRGVVAGAAIICLRNDTPDERRVVIGVGRYSSGEAVMFDISVQIIDASQGCTLVLGGSSG